MNPDSMHVVVLYEGETPMAYFFKDGLESEKVVSHLTVLPCCVTCSLLPSNCLRAQKHIFY